MRRKCPNCGKMPEIPERGGYCIHCGTYIPPRQVVASPAPRAAGSTGSGCPWEEMGRVGFWKSLWDTISGVLFSPNTFFARMPVTGGIGKPLLFGLLVGSVSSIVDSIISLSGWLWPMGLRHYPGMAEFPDIFPLWMSRTALVPLVSLTAPMMVLVGMFLWAGILHLCLMLVGGAQRGFEATFRVVAYSEAASLFRILPFCGSVVALPWMIVVQIIGFKQAHQISSGKAVGAMLLPLLLCCACVMSLILTLGIGAISTFLPNLLR
ncbi:MAG: YIP1 family protein [Calditrichaeota bacterium]|nr:YIP1 family protein [Calditrichota bacterium]